MPAQQDVVDQSEEFCCVACGAPTTTVLRPYAVERAGKLVIIRDVPMHECEGCAETYMAITVMKRLDELIAGLLACRADEVIVRYSAAA